MRTSADTKTRTLSGRICASWKVNHVDFSSTRSEPIRARP